MNKFDAALQTTAKTVKVKAEKPAKGRGSRGGKYANTAYIQVSGYIKKDTLKAVKRAMIDHAEGKDFSDLLEDLLVGWVKSVDR